MVWDKAIESILGNENTFKQNIINETLIRLNWPSNWQWYVDILREREQAILDYKKSSPKALALGAPEKVEKRTVLPFPITTSGYYGWLAVKKEFRLEIFGPYYESMKNSPYGSVPNAANLEEELESEESSEQEQSTF